VPRPRMRARRDGTTQELVSHAAEALHAGTGLIVPLTTTVVLNQAEGLVQCRCDVECHGHSGPPSKPYLAVGTDQELTRWGHRLHRGGGPGDVLLGRHPGTESPKTATA
jgi:hypothetical protein